MAEPLQPRTSGSKPLVLCADDYAFHAGVSQAVCALADQSRLTATSVMVLSPRWRTDAAALAERRGRLDVGLHLDWTSPFAQVAGHGATLLAAMRRAVFGGFDTQAARGVIERQLDLFEATWGAPPDHVDGHQHVQQFAGIREALVAVIARRYPRHLPWLRVSRAPAGQRTFKTAVLTALGAAPLVRLARAAGIPCAPALSGIYGFDLGVPGYGRQMEHWLRSAPAGTEIMCHPGAPDASVPDEIAAARTRELDYLSGSAFVQALQAAGVRLERGSTLYRSGTLSA